MRIDAYGHDVPLQYYKDMGEFHPSISHQEHDEIGGFFDPERRIRHLDEFDIDRQIVALGGPHLWRGVDPEAGLPLVRQANDEIREVADDYPDRYIPVGTLPIDPPV